MSSKIKAVLTVVGVGVAAYLAYRMIFAKQIAATTIVKAGKSSNYQTLLTFDVEYLKDWAKAVKNGLNTFIHKGITYNTQGGKSVK